MINIQKLFMELVLKIHRIQGAAFSGMGLLLYNNIHSINPYHCSLTHLTHPIPNLHLKSPKLVTYLENISSIDHPCHDGFHFINHNGCLTHVAQFLSPPINKNYNNIYGQGARTLCSLNGSIINGVLMIAIITSKRDIYFFKNGRVIDPDFCFCYPDAVCHPDCCLSS